MQLIKQLITRSVFCINKSCTVVFTEGIIKIFLKRLIEEVTVCFPACQTASGTASLFSVMASSTKNYDKHCAESKENVLTSAL